MGLVTRRSSTPQDDAGRARRSRTPTQPRLIGQQLRVRLRAPSSLYDGCICEVDAEALRAAVGTDRLLDVQVVNGASTVAFADELELEEPARPARDADRGDGRQW